MSILRRRTICLSPHGGVESRRKGAMRNVWIGTATFVILMPLRLSHAAEFSCAAGDVACLRAAINAANGNGEANTPTLEAGTYTVTAVDNLTDGANGLPLISETLTIRAVECTPPRCMQTSLSRRTR